MKNNRFWFGFPLRPIQRIALAGLFIALATIFNKVIAVNYIPAVPFVRISFGGPAIIIFSGYLLGPIYGAAVGALSDVVGYFIYDIKSFPYSPMITITYLLLGFFSGVLLYFLPKIKNIKATKIGIYSVLFVIFITLTILLFQFDTWPIFGGEYKVEVWLKSVISAGMFILFAGLLAYMHFMDKKFKGTESNINIYALTACLLILEIAIMVLVGSTMKAVLFGFQLFPIILLLQAIALFFNVPFNVFIIFTLNKILNSMIINKGRQDV